MGENIGAILNHRFSRFLFAGGLNTLLTYVIYLILLQWFPYWISYTTAYVAGIFLAYRLSRSYVFRTDRGYKSVLLFPFVYVTQYLVGMVVLWAWIDVAGLYAELGPLVATLVTIPTTYLISRFIFVSREKRRP